MEAIWKDIDTKNLDEHMLLDRNEWRKIIHVINPV